MSDAIIRPTHSARNLGVVFDAELKMSDHIFSVCKSSMAAIQKIGKIRKYLDVSTTLVYQLVISRIDYCNSLLSNTSSVHLDRIQRLQNLCARIVLRLQRRDSARVALHNLHWLPVHYCKV